MIVGIDSCITIYWAVSSIYGERGQTATTANLLFQVSTILSYIPIIREVICEPEIETKPPWVFWMFAYVIETVVLWVQVAKWEEWVYPIVNLFLCLILVIIAKPRR